MIFIICLSNSCQVEKNQKNLIISLVLLINHLLILNYHLIVLKFVTIIKLYNSILDELK